MIRFLENLDLKHYNTFGIEAIAQLFFEFTEREDLCEYIQANKLPGEILTLGGGSNFLFTKNYEGLILHPNIPGIGLVNEDRNHIYIEAGAGENWDDLVNFCVKYELGGLENLSNIPGKVGASPVQNIGAYGKEAKDHIWLVKGVDIETGNLVEYTNDQCRFGYRDSVFKNELKGRIVITSVVFQLDKFPEYRLEYGALKAEAEKLGEINLSTIRQAVINIRTSKLPAPEVIGNAGSFFKNPLVETAKAEELKKNFPSLPVYSTDEPEKTKLAAGWLIEQCGWKGFRDGDAGVHKDQALVLVNYGKATGEQLLVLAEKIKTSVVEKFGVTLEPEVNVI